MTSRNVILRLYLSLNICHRDRCRISSNALEKVVKHLAKKYIFTCSSVQCPIEYLILVQAWKKWCTQILTALHYLHSCEPQIVHGNLTCNTIFIQHNGLIKIGCGNMLYNTWFFQNDFCWINHFSSCTRSHSPPCEDFSWKYEKYALHRPWE